ncbi:MAG TPA: ribonuclease E/G [Fusobacterium sp.]|uniref:ribonuclease E/G n=1 Tax=Fusobacterium sp. TaxID=68766 RepID=UPI002F4175EB
MLEFLWTSDLFYHKVAVFREAKLWDLRIEERKKLLRNGLYVAKKEREDFLLLSNGVKVFCSEAFPRGQEKLVQVLQEEREGKLAEVSQKIEMATPYFVFFPYERGLYFSRKIQEKEERERLQNIFQPYQEKASFLIRTEAKGQQEETLQEEIQKILKEWNRIQKRAFDLREKGNLRTSLAWMEEFLEEYGKEEWKSCYCENFEYQELLEKSLLPYQKKVREYHGDVSLWKQKKMEEQIAQLCQEKVHLPSGGYLFLEKTKACVTIDVNRGAAGLHTSNLEAAREIPRQVRLRNLAGIIVIDFISNKNLEERKEIINTLKQGFSKDNHILTWGGLHEFDLFIFSRQRKGKELSFYYDKNNIFYQVQCLENECKELLERGENILSVEGEKNILQEWKNSSQCGIKDSIELLWKKEKEERTVFQIKIK